MPKLTEICRKIQHIPRPCSSHLSHTTRDSTNNSLADDRERSIVGRNYAPQVLIPNNSNRCVEHVSNNCWRQALIKAKRTLFTKNVRAYSKCTSGTTWRKWLTMELEPGLDQVYGESCGLSHHCWQWCQQNLCVSFVNSLLIAGFHGFIQEWPNSPQKNMHESVVRQSGTKKLLTVMCHQTVSRRWRSGDSYYTLRSVIIIKSPFTYKIDVFS